MRWSLALLLFTFFFIPYTALATANAGVVGGVWFSKNPIFEGEVVSIYAAVQNQHTAPVSGSVVFLVDGTVVGSQSFSTTSANACIPSISVPHTFSYGTHTVTAYIGSADTATRYATLPTVSIFVDRDSDNDGIGDKDDPTPGTTANNTNATSTTSNTTVITNITNAGDTIVTTVANDTADRIEDFRDSVMGFTPGVVGGFVGDSGNAGIVSATSTQSARAPIARAGANEVEPGARIETPRNLFDVSLEIAKSDTLPVWKKFVGIALSCLSCLFRCWWPFWILLILGYLLYRLIRWLLRRYK